MQADQLQYNNLQNVIASFSGKGRAESRTFLNWFLESIFRLDRLCCTNPVRDSSCESSVIAGVYEQTEHTDLQDAELARV